MADTIIVGAGIAGLYVGLNLARRGERVTILEAENHIGGRALTSRRYGYEIGAGRICECHWRLQNLLKHYGLHMQEIKSHNYWMSEKEPGQFKYNYFDDVWPSLCEIFNMLPHDQLAATTLGELTRSILFAGQYLLDHFPYRAELESIRADLALNIFDREFKPGHKFYVVKEGFSALIRGMVRGFREHSGCKILTQNTVIDVKRLGQSYMVTTATGIQYQAQRVIFAIPAQALKHIHALARHPVLQYLEQSPLTRIYARYPHTQWIRGHVITDSPLRYIIPVKSPWVMISYTDGKDTKKWSENPAKEIAREQQRLFPGSPAAEEVHAYPWSVGTTVWVPGKYDVQKAARQLRHPYAQRLPNVWICGESLSIYRQAWIEGALEDADELLKCIV